MCLACDKVKTLPLESALEVIALELKKGRDPEHFKPLLDSLLGTEEAESNADLDKAWEIGHRRQ